MSKNRLFKKFMLAFCSLVLLPFVIVLAFFLVQAGRLQLDNDLFQKDNLSSQTVNSVKGQAELAQNMCTAVIQNENILTFLDKEFEASPDLLYYQTTIRDFVKVTNGVSDVKLRLYVEGNTIPLGFAIFYPMHYINKSEDFRNFYADNTQMDIWKYEGFNDELPSFQQFNGVETFHYLHKIMVGTRVIGVIEAIMPEKFFWGASSLNDQGSYPFLTDEYCIFNYSSVPIDELPLQSYLNGPESGLSKNVLYSKYELSDGPFNVMIITDRSPITQLSIITFGLLLVFFIVMMTGFFAYNRRLVSDIHHCLDNMEYGLTNEFEMPPSDAKLMRRADEISVLAQRISYLLEQTRLLLRQKIKEETAAKQAELLALQHQINPHFLYNTMELFSARMEFAGLYEESSALSAFCKMLRYNINTKDMMSTLNDELKQVNNYLAIQRLRDVAFVLQIDISNKLREEKAIRFLLEPFIENSFKYRGTSSPLIINISARKSGDKIIIKIENNGEEITQGRLRELNRRFKHSPITLESGGDKIGLTNINSRLKLFYGDSHFIRVACKNGKTSFIFSVVLRKDSEQLCCTKKTVPVKPCK